MSLTLVQRRPADLGLVRLVGHVQRDDRSQVIYRIAQGIRSQMLGKAQISSMSARLVFPARSWPRPGVSSASHRPDLSAIAVHLTRCVVVESRGNECECNRGPAHEG